MGWGTPLKDNLFLFVTDLSKPYSPHQIDYLRLYQAVPKELKSGKTPLQLLDDSIKDVKSIINDSKKCDLETYRQPLNPALKILDFHFFICRERPELERSCFEDVGWLRFHYKIVKRIVKYINEVLSGNYDKKILAKKTKNIQSIYPSVLIALEEIRKIMSKQYAEPQEEFPVQERRLYERPLTVETPQQPNNPVPNKNSEY